MVLLLSPPGALHSAELDDTRTPGKYRIRITTELCDTARGEALIFNL